MRMSFQFLCNPEKEPPICLPSFDRLEEDLEDNSPRTSSSPPAAYHHNRSHVWDNGSQIFAKEYQVPHLVYPSTTWGISSAFHNAPSQYPFKPIQQRVIPRIPVSSQCPSRKNLSNVGIVKSHSAQRTHHPLRSERKIVKPKKPERRKSWTKMTPELFARITAWEDSQKGIIKQSDIEKKWNVNRTTYYRWKQRRDTANWTSEAKLSKLSKKDKF